MKKKVFFLSFLVLNWIMDLERRRPSKFSARWPFEAKLNGVKQTMDLSALFVTAHESFPLISLDLGFLSRITFLYNHELNQYPRSVISIHGYTQVSNLYVFVISHRRVLFAFLLLLITRSIFLHNNAHPLTSSESRMKTDLFA